RSIHGISSLENVDNLGLGLQGSIVDPAAMASTPPLFVRFAVKHSQPLDGRDSERELTINEGHTL
ncbi:unnamed protein product, partial [Chrysoparadoxa australica]